jgi:putative MATE family efflux protein
VIFLLVSLGGGLAVAGTILVAQFTGRRSSAGADYISAQTYLFMVVISLIFTVIGYYFSEPLVRMFGVEEAVVSGAASYLRITFLGIIFLFGFFVFQSLLRGAGDVKTPMYIVLGTVLLNLVFDPLFIFGQGFIPGFGVAGAAVATVATQALAAAAGLFILLSGRYDIHLKLKNFRPDFSVFKKMLKLGLPASTEHFMMALGITGLMFVVAGFGTTVIASYGIGMRIFGFIIIPAFGMAEATTTLVGQNIGAGKIERAGRIANLSVHTAFITLTLAGAALFLFSEQIVAVFIRDDSEVVEMGARFVRIMAFGFGFIGAKNVLGGAFRGSGNTFLSMVLGISYFWFMRLPIAYFLSNYTAFEETGIWLSFPLASVMGALLAWGFFRNGKWKHRKLIQDFPIFTEGE